MQQEHKTIFAPATHPGKAGVAVIRISGDQSSKLFGNICNVKNPTPRKAIFTNFTHPKTKEIIDHGILIWFPSPNSFTGEDTIELHIHGSIAIINNLMEILSGFEMFRVALPGEFARRAFLNGKMDLTRAEGLADLIEAETSLQHKQALRQMSGELEKLYDSWRIEIIKILANIEAYIDFPDEDDIPQDLIEKVENSVNNLVAAIEYHLSDNNRGEKLRSGIYVAITGKPNAGKSSLLNYLARRDVAIVSHIAGTTRDVIEVHLDIAGIPITLADTAGIRESNDIIEEEGIRRAKEKSQNSDFNIVIFDANEVGPDKETYQLINENSLIVINKIDSITNQKFDDSGLHNPTYISLKNHTNLDGLIKRLEEKANAIISPSSDPVITRARYRNHLSACRDNLKLFSLTKELELAAEDLRMAARELGQITGIIDIDTILDEIFSNFCIGK